METLDAPASLSSLPQVLIDEIGDLLLASSSPKEAIQLTTVSKALRKSILRAGDVWKSFSERQGFLKGKDYPKHSLNPEQNAPEGWYYHYIGRMQNRVLVRQTLRQYNAFLENTSAAALHSRASIMHLWLFQKWMTFSMPWQVWELYRSHDGQQKDSGVHFAYSARLLSLLEIMKEASGSTLLDMSEEVWQSIDQKAVASTDAGLKLWVHTTLRHAEMFMSNKTFYLWNEEEEDKLLPMTTYFEGKKRFYFGEKGHIYLGNEFVTWKVADSLVEWLQRMLH